MARDPVCGMQVNEDRAAGTSEYQGQTYYFCSTSCKQQFDQNPERYTGREQPNADRDSASFMQPARGACPELWLVWGRRE